VLVNKRQSGRTQHCLGGKKLSIQREGTETSKVRENTTLTANTQGTLREGENGDLGWGDVRRRRSGGWGKRRKHECGKRFGHGDVPWEGFDINGKLKKSRPATTESQQKRQRHGPGGGWGVQMARKSGGKMVGGDKFNHPPRRLKGLTLSANE